MLFELEEIKKRAKHAIPFYAYGDNEAAVDMSHRLEDIAQMTEQIINEVTLKKMERVSE